MSTAPLLVQLERYLSRYPEEGATVTRFRELLTSIPRPFENDQYAPGHVTGSAWLLNLTGDKAMLTHHRKLNIWVQLGGHSDGSPDTPQCALREAREESGIDAIHFVDDEIFDLDIHEIPARKEQPSHLHFDVRYLVQAEQDEFRISSESRDLRWTNPTEILQLSIEESLLRMRHKWLALRG